MCLKSNENVFKEIDIQDKIRRTIKNIFTVPLIVAWSLVGFDDIYYPIWLTNEQICKKWSPTTSVSISHLLHLYLSFQFTGLSGIKNENLFGPYNLATVTPSTYEQVVKKLFSKNKFLLKSKRMERNSKWIQYCFHIIVELKSNYIERWCYIQSLTFIPLFLILPAWYLIIPLQSIALGHLRLTSLF